MDKLYILNIDVNNFIQKIKNMLTSLFRYANIVTTGEENMTDINKLKECISNSGLKASYIINHLGLSGQGYYNKLGGKYEFTLDEARNISEILGLTEEERNAIFFCNSNEE